MIKLAQFKIPGTGGQQELPIPSGIPQELTGGLYTSGKSIFDTGSNLLFIAATVLTVIFIIYSGIEWITSSGDPEKIQSAKRRFYYSIVGLIVVASAFLIKDLVLKVLS